MIKYSHQNVAIQDSEPRSDHGGYRKGGRFTLVDLNIACFRVPICPHHRPFLCFAFQGQAYQFKGLPFGLSLSPSVDQGGGSSFVHLQLSGLKILLDLDDWFISVTEGQMASDLTDSPLGILNKWAENPPWINAAASLWEFSFICHHCPYILIFSRARGEAASLNWIPDVQPLQKVM